MLDMAPFAPVFGGVAPSENHDLQTYLRALAASREDVQQSPLLAMSCLFPGSFRPFALFV